MSRFEGFDNFSVQEMNFGDFGSFSHFSSPGMVNMEDDVWPYTYNILSVLYNCFHRKCSHRKNKKCTKCSKTFCENNMLYLKPRNGINYSEVPFCIECYERNKSSINNQFSFPPLSNQSQPPYRNLAMLYNCYADRCNHCRDIKCTKCRQNFCHNNMLYLRPKYGQFQYTDVEICRQCYIRNKTTVDRELKFPQKVEYNRQYY